MATGGVLGNGTKVAYSAASPANWIRIGQLMDIPKFIQLIANLVDTTVHSTSNIMTTMPGMIPAPDIEIMLLADNDETTSVTHEFLRTAQDSGATNYYRIEVPTNRAQTKFRPFEFQAFVKEYSIDTKIADKQTTKITLTYAGGYSVYPASSGSIT